MDIQDEDYMDFKYDNELNKSSKDEFNEKSDEAPLFRRTREYSRIRGSASRRECEFGP